MALKVVAQNKPSLEALHQRLMEQHDVVMAGIEALEALYTAERGGSVSSGALEFVVDKMGDHLIQQLDTLQELESLLKDGE